MVFLAQAIKSLDPAPNKKTDLTLLLTLLSEQCEQKLNQYTEEIEAELRSAGGIENKTLPISNVLARHKETRAYVKDDAGKIAGETATAIKKFIAGGGDNIVDGIAGLVTTGIEAIIGAGSGSSNTLSSYFIVVQSYAIIRLDIRVWTRQIEASGLTKSIEQMFVAVAYKSSVNVNSIGLNTFLATYQDQLAKLGVPESDWDQYLNNAEALYTKLAGEAPRRSLPANVVGVSQVQSSYSTSFHPPAQLYSNLWDGDFDDAHRRLVEGRYKKRAEIVTEE